MTPRVAPPTFRCTLAALCMAALFASCVFNFTVASQILCLLDGDCIRSEAVYPRTVAAVCLVSYGTLACRHRSLSAVYGRNVDAHTAYSPITAADRRRVLWFRAFAVVTCAAVALSVNVCRVWLLFKADLELVVLMFFVIMYTQNASLCLVEIHFMSLCFVLRKMFVNVNRDLERFGEEEAAAPGAGLPGYSSHVVGSPSAAAHHHRRVTYDSDFYAPRWPGGQSTANAVEVLRIRHRLIRDAVYAIIDLYGMPMGMSLFALCVMALFDIYYEVFQNMGANTRSTIFLYLWLLQYSIRFYGIVAMAHNTSKQVGGYPCI